MFFFRRAFDYCALVLAAAPPAHDIPNDVTVQTFLKPEGQRLRLLVRVPLQAMRDMDYPKPRGTRNADLLDLARAEPTLRDAATLWVSDYLDLYENGDKLRAAARRLGARRAAVGQVVRLLRRGAGAPDRRRTSRDDGVFLEPGAARRAVRVPDSVGSSRFSIDPRLARLGIRTLTVLRFLPPGGAVRGFEFLGDPGVVLLDPRWHQAALQFVKLGFLHILDGTDHLLFLVCLVIPFRRFRSLVAVVTAFTVAHSITLIASAYNLAPDALWFPPLIETLIATSIVYMALENIVFAADQKNRRVRKGRRENDISAISASSAVFSSALKRRWLVTFGFGLVHGFGFSFALRQTLQFAGSHLLTSLLSFNVGVELGQLLVLAMLIPALDLLFRYVVDERIGTIMLSAIVAHTAWHWMGERWELLRKFTFTCAGLRRRVFCGVAALDDAAGRRGGALLAGLRDPTSGQERRPACEFLILNS